MAAQWPAVEADFARFYRIDARRVWRRPRDPELIGARRLVSLVSALFVYDSALRSATTDDPAGEEWSVSEELLAQAVDSLNVLAHGHQRRGKPKPVERPSSPQVRRVSSAQEIDAFFGGG